MKKKICMYKESCLQFSQYKHRVKPFIMDTISIAIYNTW